MSDDIDVLKDEEKEKLLTVESDDLAVKSSNEVSTYGGNNNNWVGGLILIGIGATFLLSNVFDFYIDNWWAFFILVPGVVKVGKAFQHSRDNGRFADCSRAELTWGLILILVAFTFLFNWSWGLIWPVFLIIFGMGALLSGLLGH